MDPRVEWIHNKVRWGLRQLEASAVSVCFEKAQLAEEIASFCEADGSKENRCSVIHFYVEGDSRTDQDGYDDLAMKPKNGRLCVALDHLPADLVLSEALRSMFFLKITPDPIAKAHMEGQVATPGNPMDAGLEYGVLDCPRLATVRNLLCSLYLPAIDTRGTKSGQYGLDDAAAAPTELAFDRDKHSAIIEVSEDGMKAQLMQAPPDGVVPWAIGNIAMTAGHYEWTVRCEKGVVNEIGVGLGHVRKDRASRHPKNAPRLWIVAKDGSAVAKGEAIEGNEPLAEGDTVSFHYDAGFGVLEVSKNGKQWHRFEAVQGDIYPCLSLVDVGDSAELTAFRSSTGAAEGLESEKLSHLQQQLQDDVKSSLVRFAQSVGTVIHQVSGDRKLHIPSHIHIGDTDDDVRQAQENDDLLAEIDEHVLKWNTHITAVIESQQQNDSSSGKSPLSEIDFWKDKSAVLSAIYEQLNLPHVKNMLRVLRESDVGTSYPNFEISYNNLAKMYHEARDNVNFLGTLERHFRAVGNVVPGQSLQPIIDTLPSMLTAIRMVWTISRYYNTDEKMMRLLEKIANTLSEKVSRHINVKSVPGQPSILSCGRDRQGFDEAKRKILEGQAVLEQWKNSYQKTRQDIEQTERDARWEFDKKRLFGTTDYMALRCIELLEIVNTLEYYHTVLGSQLKAVTKDTAGIDQVMKKVEDLKKPIETVAFDIFDERAQPSWSAQYDRFKRQVDQMNAHTRQFIESSFKHLRSSEAAFELLQSFKSLPARSGMSDGDWNLGNLLMKKSDGILDRYKEELLEVEAIFRDNCDDPPLTKNQPPIAGAIHWSDSLFQRIKGPIKKFMQTEESILTTVKGKEIRKQYVAVAKLMKEYQGELYDKWKAEVNNSTIDYLAAPIIAKHKSSHGETTYAVNFDHNLFQIIQEAKYLDRLGYDVPGIALRVTLLDEKYHDFVENLKSMLARYHDTLAVVEAPERAILGEHIAQLESAIEPGWRTLNWNSLGIKEYINKALAAIGEFNAKSKEIHKNSTHIAQVVQQISTTWLVDPLKLSSSGTEGLLDLNDLAESLEAYRNKQVQRLTKQYARISPLLRKIEGIVTNTNTGKSPALRSYYLHWEKKIYHALRRMVMISLSLFLSFLNINPSKKHKSSRKPTPLFKVTASLVAGEIGVTPEMKEILHTLTAKIMNNIIEATKHFVRWMDGTCIDCTHGEIHPKPAEDSDCPPFTFYNDISKGNQVISFKTKVNQGIQKTFFYVHKHLQSWRKYKDLWHVPKEKFIEKLGAKNLPWLEYDARFADFTRLIKGLDQYPQERNIDFLCLDSTPLLAEIQREARVWIQMEGRQLNEQFRSKLDKLNSQICKTEDELNIAPEHIEDLKRILSTIDTMHTISMDVELRYREIEHAYSALRQYSISIPEEEWNLALGLRHHWERLKTTAKSKDEGLAGTKETFRQVTIASVLKFKDELDASRVDFLENGPGKAGLDLDKGLEQMNEWKIDLLQKQKKREELVKSEKLFALDISAYPALQNMEDRLLQLNSVYELYAEWKELVSSWSNTQWADVQIEGMRKGTEGTLQKLKKKYREFGELPPYNATKEAVNNFYTSLPLFTQLKTDALRDRHWQKLMQVTGKTFDFANFTLAALIEMKPFQFEDDINEIVAGATRELHIENSLKAIKDKWTETSFELVQKKRTKLLADTREIQETIDEHVMNLQSIANFKWVKPFLDDVRLWERKLNTMTDVIAEWIVVQQKWIYLESIFVGGDDIAAQLPKEAKKFDDLDKKWVAIMKSTGEMPMVDAACHATDRLGDLKWISDKLDECQKGLTDYLNTKRMTFPRFYFISNDDLLSILSSANPRSVQEHMLKMFDNCAVLQFKQGSDAVEGTYSQEREVLVFDTAVNTEGLAVEKWLNEVLLEVRKTLRGLLKASVYYYPKKQRLLWVDDSMGMCSLAGSQIWWTYQVEDAFNKVKKGKKNAVKELVVKLSAQLDEMVMEMDKSLESQQRKKINTLIIVDVHGRDIVDRFVRDAILDARDFAWESQLRFYWKRDIDNCVIHQCTAVLNYGYEFMGLNGRLVITPLTDRCFMTLTQALSYFLGGAPGGPAGTGKTESVKDLAKSLSYYCVVFNCGEGLDFKAMASIFCGLGQCGAWGCFDEFNRIELPVLSVVSEQLRAMQDALKHGHKSCEIQGATEEIRLDPNVGVFITMNPGYAGRVELPDNLKALFRPVVMVVPNLELIAEIMLYAEGFRQARALAKKMVTLYKLAKGQLSKQYHYDWGLRALKAVLVMAGALKRSDADLPEDVVLMRALRDMNAPKFVFEDVPLFSGLIGDLFPGLDPTRVPNEKLARAVKDCISVNRDMVVTNQIDKVVQLYETMQTRHTSMVVGPTSGGKTTVIQYLKQSQDMLKLPTKLFILNAKAQHISCLYGVLDPMTRTWTDGIFSNIFRNINRDSEREKEQGNEATRRYVVFDGDVDALWVENMNTVMDDNKLLTLANGDRIRLNYPMCSLLFEVGDLQYASPATVSRVGMVYVDPQNLQWQPYMYKWVVSRSKEEQDALKELFEKYIPALRSFVLDGIDVDGNVVPPPKLALPLTDCNMVKQLCLLLQCLLKDQQLEQRSLEGVFIFACVWSFGAVILENDRPRFDQVIKSKSGKSLQPSEDLKPVAAGQLPEKKTLYEFCFDSDQARWIPWQDPSMVPSYVPPKDGKFSSILVPTVDTVRNSFFLDLIVDKQLVDPKTGSKTPVLLIGASGTAKTVTIQKFLRDLKDKQKDAEKDEVKLDELTLEMNFSSRTTSVDVQKTLEENVEKRTATILGAPPGKKLIVFVDDINMPVVDTYGTMQPITWLKLLIEWGGWYDRKDLVWKHIKDVEYVAAMAPPGGGRNALDPRFVSLFASFNIPFPATQSLETIYTQILHSHISTFTGDAAAALLAQVPKVCSLTMSVYNLLCQKLPPTPAKFHYIFNLRDLSRVYEGMCRMNQESYTSVRQMVRLWRNEVLRVFHDRMPDDQDKSVVIDKIRSLVAEHFTADEEYVLKDPVLFGDFADIDAEERLALYEDIGDFESVRKTAEAILEEYNTPSVKMSLVMFDMAIDHLVRITRILSLPRGHALLVGVGGSGKQSLTRLATHAAGISQVFEVTISRGYNEDAFRENLKDLYRIAGVDDGGAKVVFLFTDSHVAQEGFLEAINNMLASGTVPALFADDEKDACCNAVIADVEAAGFVPTKEIKWNFFVSRVRDNLHIVLSMSPSGDKLRTRCRNFPALVNNTVIDWFTKWPDQALKAVSHRYLEDYEKRKADEREKAAQRDMSDASKTDLPDDSFPAYLKSLVVDHMVFTHLKCDEQCGLYKDVMKRMHYVTPKNFLDYISNYTALLDENRTRIDELRKKLRTGLDRLKDAAETVVEMQVKMSEQQVHLDEMKQANDELVLDLSKKQADAKEKSERALAREKEVAETKTNVMQNMKEAEEVLEEAMPAVMLAEKELDKIHKKDMDELRTFAKPSEKIVAVAEMYCVMQGKTASWQNCKADLQNPNFVTEKLKKFPKDSITERRITAVNAIRARNKDVNDVSIQAASIAAAGLYGWVMALVAYYAVAKKVEPKKMLVQRLEKNLSQLERELDYLRAEVRALNDMKEMLTERLERGQSEAKRLEDDARVMQKRLNNARRLIGGLASERQRWTDDFERLGKSRKKLVGDCLLGACFLSYLGAFTFTFREEALLTLTSDVREREIEMNEDFSLQKLLTTDVLISKWNADGLPSDELSIQNGILATRASTFPLCVDPQKQAVGWIKRMFEKSSKFEVATFAEPNFPKRLEAAIQYGQPFLFENVDEFIDPILDPILEKKFIYQSGQKLIKVGDKQVEYDKNFRLFMTTKLSNPNYTPEIFGKSMVINFGVTLDGLRDQLLNEVVLSERNDLARHSEELIHSMAENKQTLQLLEDTLIRELSLAQGEIIDNDDLITTLEDTKSSAEDIAQKLESALATKRDIDRARQDYLPVAKRGAILFFCIAGISAINSMYEYSLAAFLHDVFKVSLERSEGHFEPEQRLENIITYLTRCLYQYVCMGIFQVHVRLFSFLMTARILEGADSMDAGELDFFMKGCLLPDKDFPDKPECPWLTEVMWHAACRLSRTSPVFVDLPNKVTNDDAEWQDWLAQQTPESDKVPLPGGYSNVLSPFQKLCLLRCFRVDRVYLAVGNFISVTPALGPTYAVPYKPDLKDVFAQSTANSPIVCITTPGANPTEEIDKLAQKMEMKDSRMKALSLGQGQGSIAMGLVEQGSIRGHWVLLQNCHLLIDWMKEIEKTLEKRDAKPHPEFRLWLTTEPSEGFPLGILQRSLKVVFEPPDGLKMNMTMTFTKVSEETLEECPHPAFRPLVFTLAFFHAVVQERRKYGKLGWNVIYDFNETDFTISMRLMCTYLTKAWEDKSGIPWETLRYLVGEAMYGGRVSDDWDRRVVTVYLQEYFGDFLFDSFQPFHFYQDADCDYSLPPGSTNFVEVLPRDAYVNQVKDMHNDNSPEVFGLHPNAEIGYLTTMTKSLWANLLLVQSVSGSAASASATGGESADDKLKKLSQEVMAQLPEAFDRKLVMMQEKKKNPDGFLTPVQVVLLQELERWNALVTTMMSSLKELLRALAGIIGMSADLDDLASALLIGQLPPSWRRKAPATNKALGSWMVHFKTRYEQYRDWIDKGEPVVMWLSGVMIPDSFIAALVQTTCRKYKWPLDRSGIFTRVTEHTDADEIVERPEDGAYVKGLYLEGAKWDYEKRELTTQDPKRLISGLPVLLVIPMEINKIKRAGTFVTPVYITQGRKNAAGVGHVFDADLSTSKHASHWVLNAVGLCLNSDD
ncbi:Dynein-1-alpha heavy chain [Diplonema papillatum]|nr:Dynein-1-alpha heavy chain [Diplonema papillatum]